MAIGKKTGGRDYVKGKPGGPGRNRTPEDLKQARAMLRADFERTVHRLMRLPKEEMQRVLKDEKNEQMLTLFLGSIIGVGSSKGDHQRMQFILDRVIGPVPKSVEITGHDGEAFRPFANFTGDEITDKIAQFDEFIKSNDAKKTTDGT